MRIEEYNIERLEKELTTGSLWTNKEVPISKHKIISHINNPRAMKDDIVLLVAFNEENEIIGYLGALPDRINTINEIERFAWLTCWWVNSDKRYSKNSLLLLFRMLKIYDNNIGISDFTERAKSIYDSTGKFYQYQVLTENRYYVRFCGAKFLPERYPIFRRLRTLIELADISLNLFFDLRFNKSPDNIRTENVKELDKEITDFVIKFISNHLNQRTVRELEWILRYPWIKETKKMDDIAQRYRFLSVAEIFYYDCVKVYNEIELVGFIIFRLRDSELKIQYIYFENKHIDVVCKVIIKRIKEIKPDLFTCRNDILNDYLLKLKIPYIHLRKNKKYIYLSKNLEKNVKENLRIQEGDGDNAFT